MQAALSEMQWSQKERKEDERDEERWKVSGRRGGESGQGETMLKVWKD